MSFASTSGAMVCLSSPWMDATQPAMSPSVMMGIRHPTGAPPSTTVSASRGTIYDRNGRALALSSTAENVFLSPMEIAKGEQDKALIATKLSEILDVDVEKLLAQMEKTYSQYEIVKKRVDQEDADAVREKLSGFVAGGFAHAEDDPQTAGLLEIAKDIREWRPKAKRGKKIYDDEAFVQSLADQFARRHSLSVRQVAALRRVLAVYRDKIPNYESRMNDLGFAQENAARS